MDLLELSGTSEEFGDSTTNEVRLIIIWSSSSSRYSI